MALHPGPPEDWPRHVVKMATGAGKTKVPSLLIAWSFFHRLYLTLQMARLARLAAPIKGMLAFCFLIASRESVMPTLVVKNLPEPLHERLKAQAVQHRRSVTKEVIFVLEQGLLAGRRRAPLLLPPPYVLKGGPLTIEQIEAAIEDGRQ